MSTQLKKTPAKRPVVKKESAPVVEAVVAQPAPVATSTKSAKLAKVETTPIVVPPAEQPASATSEAKKRARREVSTETVDGSFNSLINSINTRIDEVHTGTEKTRGIGVKFLRSVNKALKLLKQDYKRVSTRRQKTNRVRTTPSGFMKPVKISDDLAKFTGWDHSKEYSRTAVTRFLCDYIKSHNLQLETDRRNIKCDVKLQSLLRYDEKTQGGPLTYFRLQRVIQPHFIKTSVV